jgi:hypothetical protein
MYFIHHVDGVGVFGWNWSKCRKRQNFVKDRCFEIGHLRFREQAISLSVVSLSVFDIIIALVFETKC